MHLEGFGSLGSSRILAGIVALFALTTVGQWGVTLPAPEPAAASSAAGGALAATVSVALQIPPPRVETPSPAKITRKQRQDILKSKFEKMKEDAEQLSSLANSLQDELNKSSENILSLQIVEKAEKIEKLAKRIKNAAKGD